MNDLTERRLEIITVGDLKMLVRRDGTRAIRGPLSNGRVLNFVDFTQEMEF